MRDDRDYLMLTARRPDAARPAETAGAVIIPFPGRAGHRMAAQPASPVAAVAIAALLNTVGATLAPASAAHAATHLAALGALSGFAAQQSVLMTGGPGWVQPARNGQLDRLLLSEVPADASLWCALRTAAHGAGAQHLPDPKKLLDATLRCVGTTQLGRITLPLEYQLREQPQALLVQIWPVVRAAFDAHGFAHATWPMLVAAAAARRVATEQRQIPAHVALRVVMQSALAMALIEPRLIPRAVTKPGAR